MPLNHFRDSLKGPVDLLTTDDERWCDANHSVMGLFAQDSFFLERLAVRARRAVEFDADPQASAAHLFQILSCAGSVSRVRKYAPSSAERSTIFSSMRTRSAVRAMAQPMRIAAERAAMVAGLVHAEDLMRRQDRRDRIEAAGQRLADDQDIGRDAFVHVGKEFAGSSQAGLNFVGHQQAPILAADVRCFPQESLGRNDDSSFALNRLDQKSAGVGGDGLAQGPRIAEGNDFESGVNGPKPSRYCSSVEKLTMVTVRP